MHGKYGVLQKDILNENVREKKTFVFLYAIVYTGCIRANKMRNTREKEESL